MQIAIAPPIKITFFFSYRLTKNIESQKAEVPNCQCANFMRKYDIAYKVFGPGYTKSC